mmetsp:Transcript_24958/g.38607  ORF Transcript_24958/g.38607 Transcript_24958/m.38607 type:complete len:580 (+) Transcript_24958:245-1984(+)|eukprot:CAMPEP_0196821218 /NCGR_PEP_ID=MMETSP1362-20130617/78235_1 /TAXON_ID=163516 /ORGANISM="Leptocylindrus danicus, Strain CCMP1856" /LENGTH=579 /DNA_ID=CAMNT_0042200333 /DNA_START=240 /DNA_END=1982 /DNA_ORIENTATION=-
MEVAYQYTKLRSEFGKQLNLSDGETQVLDSILSTKAYDNDYIKRNPVVTGVDTTPHISESEVNTDRVITKNASMRHSEGGWPKDVDFTEQGDVTRYRKRVEKDIEFQNAIKILGSIVEKCMRQNSTVDIYEELFDGIDTEHSSEPPSAKGLAVFRDPSPVKRTATSINWHPDGSGKLAVSYSILNFQDERFFDCQMPTSSYIWDINNPNDPDIELLPSSPLCCLRFNPKSSDTLVGGSYNGLLTYYDLRKPNAPTGQCIPHATSVIEKSHHDPVYEVFWISSKTGHQCASLSTDGQMMWWDTRNLGEPTDVINLIPDVKEKDVTLGGCSLEYNTEAGPTKYMIGSEQGVVASINLRNRKMNNGLSTYDNGTGKHHGPIYSIQRNPTHTKFFLTIGDWTARIWAEDIKTPIITSKYHSSYLTSGCWSPTRPGVFFVTRMDGVVDVWDYYFRQNEVAYTHKIGDVALSSIAVHPGGKLIAVGDVSGTVSLLEVCDSLAIPQPNEKGAISAMFERETKREKNLEARAREVKREKALEEERKKKEASEKEDGQTDEKMEELLKKIDADFLALLNEDKDNSGDV